MVHLLTQTRGGWESANPPHQNTTNQINIMIMNTGPYKSFAQTAKEETTKEYVERRLEERANATQVAGDHYKRHKYETWDVILDWGLGYLDGNAVKYLSRWRLKGGVEDLKKARHYIDKLIEVESQ
jgi:hypothetical protein